MSTRNIPDLGVKGKNRRSFNFSCYCKLNFFGEYPIKEIVIIYFKIVRHCCEQVVSEVGE